MKKSAQTATGHIKVNLLHPQGIPEQLPVRFLRWLLSYGRFIVIIVELVVLACIFGKIYYEGQSNSLTDQINKEVQTLQSYAPQEAVIHATQQKMVLIQKVYNTNPEWKAFFPLIASKIPVGSQVTNIDITHQQDQPLVHFKVTATTNNQSDIALFINELKGTSSDTNNPFQNITLTSLNYDSGLITYIVEGDAKTE